LVLWEKELKCNKKKKSTLFYQSRRYTKQAKSREIKEGKSDIKMKKKRKKDA